MTIMKLHAIAVFAVVALWIYSPTWTRGDSIGDAQDILLVFLGYVLGVVYGSRDSTEAKDPYLRMFWVVIGALFGLLLGIIVGLFHWILHRDWDTIAFLTNCAFGLAFGALIGLDGLGARRKSSTCTTQ